MRSALPGTDGAPCMPSCGTSVAHSSNAAQWSETLGKLTTSCVDMMGRGDAGAAEKNSSRRCMGRDKQASDDVQTEVTWQLAAGSPPPRTMRNVLGQRCHLAQQIPARTVGNVFLPRTQSASVHQPTSLSIKGRPHTSLFHPGVFLFLPASCRAPPDHQTNKSTVPLPRME